MYHIIYEENGLKSCDDYNNFPVSADEIQGKEIDDQFTQENIENAYF